MELRQGVCDAICGAEERVQKSLVDTPEILNKSLHLIARQERQDEPANPMFSLAHAASCD